MICFSMGVSEPSEENALTCQDRYITCDAADNVISLTVVLVEERQLDVDLSVFTHLEYYRLNGEMSVSKIPEGLANLARLYRVTISVPNDTVPVIDGSIFPPHLESLDVYASKSHIKLTNWNAHSLKRLSLRGVEVDFSNIVMPELEFLDLGSTKKIVNEKFEDFIQVKSFSWLYMLTGDIATYYTTREKFPSIIDVAVDINLNRQGSEPKLTAIPAFVLNLNNLKSLQITGMRLQKFQHNYLQSHH